MRLGEGFRFRGGARIKHLDFKHVAKGRNLHEHADGEGQEEYESGGRSFSGGNRASRASASESVYGKNSIEMMSGMTSKGEGPAGEEDITFARTPSLTKEKLENLSDLSAHSEN